MAGLASLVREIGNGGKWRVVCTRQHSLPLGEGRGGGFETGSWLVACSSWKTRNKPTCMALSIQTNYHALRTTHHEPSFPHAPPPTSHIPTNNPPPAASPPPPPVGEVKQVSGSCPMGTPWRVSSRRPIQNPTTYYAPRTTHYALPPTSNTPQVDALRPGRL